MKKPILLAALLCSLVSIAGASGVTCRSGNGCLNVTGLIRWERLGPPFTPVANGTTAFSEDGDFAATVTFGGGGNGERVDQGNGWNGNFVPGDGLLWTTSGNGPLTLNFDHPPNAVGANIQADFFGAFTAQICDNLGFCFQEQGNSNSNGDGSAIFIGLFDARPFTSITFSLTSCANDCANFAIDEVSVPGEGPPPIPEPSSLLLLGTGLLGAAGALRRKLHI